MPLELVYGLLLFVGAVALLAYSAIRQWVADRSRTRRLGGREVWSESDWLARAAVPEMHRRLVTGYMEIIARHLGVHWTQLRPDDSVRTDLASPAGDDDETLESLELDMELWFDQRRLPVDKDEPWPTRIGDQIARVVAAADRLEGTQIRPY